MVQQAHLGTIITYHSSLCMISRAQNWIKKTKELEDAMLTSIMWVGFNLIMSIQSQMRICK
jgi:hypothetical protein